MAREAAQATAGGKRLLTKPGPLMPQLKSVGKVAGPVANAIDTAILVASPQARQNAVNAVEHDAKLNPALRMTKAYMDPINTGYGIAAQTTEMVNSNNAALRSEKNYANALDRKTTDAYYKGYRRHLQADRGLYTYPRTTRNQQNRAFPAQQPAPNQIVKRSFIVVPGFSNNLEGGVIKSANKKKVPEHILKLIFKGDSKALSEMGKLGNKAKMGLKKSKAITDAFNMQKHLEHPDTKHLLSWDDSPDLTKYSSFMEKAAVLGFKALTGNTGPIKALLRDLKSKNIPITRVKPEAIQARKPLTDHLPTGASGYSRGSWNDDINGFRGAELLVQKGLPRTNYGFRQLPDGTFQAKHTEGIRGGTNPSPIASLLHEAGHDMHYRVARKIGLGDKHLGRYQTGSGYADDLLKEIGANNAALQFLKRHNAAPEAMAYYKGARIPSFKTYLHSVPEEYSHSIVDKVRSLAPNGFTQDLSMRSLLP
jgi:hypothetical protein